MRGWVGGAVGTAVVLVTFGVAAVPALAADCGGAVPCDCGDRVVRDHVLTSDLGPCPGHGLQLASGVTLDGAGHLIHGRGAKDSYGIYLRGVRNAVVHNVAVTGFHHGVRFRDAHACRLSASDVFGNGDLGERVGYGVDLAVGSSENLLEGNAIHDNADEGIHFGTGSAANQLLASEIYDNGRENVYLLASDRNLLRDNHVWGGQDSLFVKDSSDNRIENNTLADATLVLRADSHDNQLVGNHLLGAGLHFQLYTAERPYRSPRDNTFEGGSIRDAATCIRFSSSVSNQVVGTELRDCGVQVRSESDDGPAENRLVGMALERRRVELDAGSLLHLYDAEGRLLETLGRARPDPPSAGVVDLSLRRIVAPPLVRLGPSRPTRLKKIQVVVQNAGTAAVTISDAATLGGLVSLEADSSGDCPAPVATQLTRAELPRTIEPGGVLVAGFEAIIDCANDRARKAPAAGDFRWRARLHPEVLPGTADGVPDNDACPRAGNGVDPGCGSKSGAAVSTDVVR